MDLKEILSVFLILFSVIDIPGNVPIIISMKEKGKIIKPLRATLVAGGLMIAFLLAGESLLGLFGIDVESFAIAGAIVIFIIAMEMILGISLFHCFSINRRGRYDDHHHFPKSRISTNQYFNWHYPQFNYRIYRSKIISNWIQQKLGKGGEAILRKVFGIILLAIAVKLFKSNIGSLNKFSGS